MRSVFLSLCLSFLAASSAQAAAHVQEITEGGAHAWLIEDHALPIVTVKISFENSGSVYDPVGKEGLATFVSQTLDEGAGDMDSLAFHSALESNAIRFGADAGPDTFTLSVQSLSEYKVRAFDLFNLALTKPRFDDTAVTRIRSGMLSELKQLEEDPQYLASLHWKELAFPNHPYGRPRHGTEATLAAITPQDLHGFTQAMLCHPYEVSVVGDITVDEVKRWLATLPKACAGNQIEAVIPDITVAEGGAAPVVVPLDVPQTVITASLPGIKRDDPKFYALEVLNHVLGGSSLTARLGKEIRDKRGLAYYAESDIQSAEHTAYIAINFATRDAQANAAVKVFRDTLATLSKEGVSKEELADAKSYITGSFPLQLDNQGALAEYLLAMQHFHLGTDYLEKRNALIDKVTLEQVNELAHTLLAHTPLIVMGGAPEKVKP